MLYTHTSPALEVDRLHLYPSVDAARADDRNGRPVFEVALLFEPQCRRVIPLWVDAEAFDPAWMAPAEFHADGSLTVRGPVPKPLFHPYHRPRG